MTIKDIAKKAGVSTASVSRVINSAANVSEELHNKVMAIIEDLEYKPNSIGKQLRTSKSEKILVLLPTMSNPFYSKVIEGIESKCNSLNYGTLLACINANNNQEKKYIELLTTKQVDGIISFFSTLDVEHINKLAESFPLVHCCEYLEDTIAPYVCIDDEKAGYDAVSYLISIGHEKIGMISGCHSNGSAYRREYGYRRALEKAGIPFKESFLVKSSYDYKGGEESCKKLFSIQEPPTAIFAVSDPIAIGAIKYLNSQGIIVGKDVDVMGFDNSSISEVFTPTLSTVSQPRFELGEIAVELLMDKITNLNSVNKSVLLSHKLILRESTRTKMPEI